VIWGETAGVDVCPAWVFVGFNVALGLGFPVLFVGVPPCGVRNVSPHDGGVRMAGRTGSITRVLLKAMYC
jgi:hypothetical protein